METKKSLSDLAVRLRILKKREKMEFINRLDEYANVSQMQDTVKQQTNPFLLQSFVFSAYYLLEGEPYAQPQFLSQMTQKDVRNRKKFNILFSGILAYLNLSQMEKNDFKKSIFKVPRFLAKIDYLFHNFQNVKD